MSWHILDVGSIWLKEFASALARRVPTLAWQPEIRWTGAFENWEREKAVADPPLTVRLFPLQRGYARFPVSAALPFAPRLTEHLLQHCDDPKNDVLICTTPYYAPVAERWPGIVVYYQTDMTVAYAGVDPRQVRNLDERMCRVAQAVCPNSERIAEYMIKQAFCQPGKITVVPNATRESNVYREAPEGPASLPEDVADLPRPIAGIIGNLAANMDWEFLRDAVRATTEFSWLFVGPTSMPVQDPAQNRARRELIEGRNSRVRFIGSRPYGELQAYARSFDLAVLPYIRREPTYSGSSTRFYEHLAACRPMLATRGFAELLGKEPLLKLVDTGAEAAAEMNRLRETGFRDRYEMLRWRESARGTWENRAAAVIAAVDQSRSSRQLDLQTALV